MTNKKNININGQDFFEDAQTECMVNLKDVDLKTYELYEAIANNDLESVKQAVINGANVNAQNQPCTQVNDTPLDCAAYWANTYNNSLEMIHLLRQLGATDYSLEKVKYLDETNKTNLAHEIQKKNF